VARTQITARYVQPYRYPSPNIPLAAIRRFARRIAERFQPEKIILFGSYAYGKPHEESDVDLLVIMRTRNAIDESIRIKIAFERLFSLDLIVRTPWQIERGLKDDNWFLREIVEKGKVLYEARNRQVGPQSRTGLGSSTHAFRGNPDASRHRVLPLPAGSGKVPQGTSTRARARSAKDHELADVLDLLVPGNATLGRLRRKADSLTQYAVSYRYPGMLASKRQMEAAMRNVDQVRLACRTVLGLPQ
jgi:uncharacterized protein